MMPNKTDIRAQGLASAPAGALAATVPSRTHIRSDAKKTHHGRLRGLALPTSIGALYGFSSMPNSIPRREALRATMYDGAHHGKNGQYGHRDNEQ